MLGKVKSYLLLSILVALLCIFVISPLALQAEDNAEELYDWEDERAELTGDIFVLNEESLEELLEEEEREDFNLYLTDRLDYELRSNRYTDGQIELLEDFAGQELNYDEVIEVSEYFTLVAIKSTRGFDPETADQRVKLYVSEVVDIAAGQIYQDITDFEFMISETQLIEGDNLRMLPEGEAIIAYLMPRLDTQYLTVEIRSVVDNVYRSHTATLEQLLWEEE